MRTVNLVNLEAVRKAYGPEPLLDGISLGIGSGERIGVVGRNGGGKSTLAALIAGRLEADGGRVTRNRGLRVGFVGQRDTLPDELPVRRVVVGDAAEHVWAGDPRIRDVLRGLLGFGTGEVAEGSGLDAGIGLDATVGELSGGERRRVALAAALIGEHDLLILDEPTNHLDIEAIDWLARHLRERSSALLVVTHDRWFLDEVCDRTWEVEGGHVHRYHGGYSAYVLAKAERERIAVATEERRQNLLRKELAWLRRGPQARGTKPRFRVDAANALIADVPALRDEVALTAFASARLGKTVYELEDVTYRVPAGSPPAGSPHDRALLDRATWRLGPGERVGLVGANGSGKTTLLRLLAGQVEPSGGTVVRGKTVRPAYLSQELAELDPAGGTSRPLGRGSVLESVQEVRGHVTVGKKDFTAGQLLERLGFRGDAQWTPVAELSGGERRRLQLLRLLMNEPNVLLLDEPTNDLDIETLTELEDILDGWPGSLVVVSHDRYFTERVCDHVIALLGDGRPAYLGGGIEEYVRRRREQRAAAARTSPALAASAPAARTSRPGAARADRATSGGGPSGGGPSGGEAWAARKELQRIERRLRRLTDRVAELNKGLAEHATDYHRVMELGEELREAEAEQGRLEDEWLDLADRLGDL